MVVPCMRMTSGCDLLQALSSNTKNADTIVGILAKQNLFMSLL